MRTELLKILRESDDYVSGQQLCDQFGVSRTAVWKAISQLREEGYDIEAVKNRGYRLGSGETPDLLTASEIVSRLHTEQMGKNCIFLESVDSTNNYAKRIAEQGAETGTLVNIAMTILLKPQIRPEHASRLTLLMAMAVVRGIRNVTGLEAGIKWPNDVVVDGHKVCGILTEMSTEIDYINYVVIGTGINVNQTEFPEEIREIAGSLKQAAGHAIARAELVAAVMEELEDLYGTFLKTEDLSALKEEYNKHCVTCGHEIRVLEPGHEYTGTTEGINDSGELIVKKTDGKTVCVYAGEVSVRGLYGYV